MVARMAEVAEKIVKVTTDDGGVGWDDGGGV